MPFVEIDIDEIIEAEKAKDENLKDFRLQCEDKINFKITDGMYESSIVIDDGEFVIKFRDDIDYVNSPIQTLRIHPSDFVDFLKMLNAVEKLYHDNKCHFHDGFCNKDFECKDCWVNKLEMGKD